MASFPTGWQRYVLTHWGWVTHTCIDKLTSIGADNGLSPGRRQAIIWTIAGILLIGPLETNFSEILIGIQTFSFKKLHLKVLSAKRRPFCLGLGLSLPIHLIHIHQLMLTNCYDFKISMISDSGFCYVDMDYITTKQIFAKWHMRSICQKINTMTSWSQWITQ